MERNPFRLPDADPRRRAFGRYSTVFGCGIFGGVIGYLGHWPMYAKYSLETETFIGAAVGWLAGVFVCELANFVSRQSRQQNGIQEQLENSSENSIRCPEAKVVSETPKPSQPGKP